MMERLLILLPTPIMLPPMTVDVSELEPAGGFAMGSFWPVPLSVPEVAGGFVPDGVPPDCVPPGCIPLWPSVLLEPGCGGVPIPAVGFAAAPGTLACGSCKFFGGFKLPMSCPAAPT